MKIHTFHSLRDKNYVVSGELVAKYEINLSALAFYYYDLDALGLFEAWVLLARRKYPDGLVHILWMVGLSDKKFKPEFFPGQNVVEGEFNFLSFYSHPIDKKTGEEVDWYSLPVVAPQWSPGIDGFIEHITGWKPFVLQSKVSIDFLIQKAKENGYCLKY